MTNHRSINLRSALLHLSLAGLLVACSNGGPSEREIQNALGSGIPDCDTSYVIATNVKKTNGIAAEGNRYQVMYSYDLRFIGDAPEDFNRMYMPGWRCQMNLRNAGIGGFSSADFPKRGEQVAMTGKMTMVRSEQGWIRQP